MSIEEFINEYRTRKAVKRFLVEICVICGYNKGKKN